MDDPPLPYPPTVDKVVPLSQDLNQVPASQAMFMFCMNNLLRS